MTSNYIKSNKNNRNKKENNKVTDTQHAGVRAGKIAIYVINKGRTH